MDGCESARVVYIRDFVGYSGDITKLVDETRTPIILSVDSCGIA